MSPPGLPEGPRTAYWPLSTAVAAQKPRGASWASPCEALALALALVLMVVLVLRSSHFKPVGPAAVERRSSGNSRDVLGQIGAPKAPTSASSTGPLTPRQESIEMTGMV